MKKRLRMRLASTHVFPESFVLAFQYYEAGTTPPPVQNDLPAYLPLSGGGTVRYLIRSESALSAEGSNIKYPFVRWRATVL